jgi:hypothetical protein
MCKITIAICAKILYNIIIGQLTTSKPPTTQGVAHMINYYTTKPMTYQQAKRFEREAYENIGTELDLDEWEEGVWTVTVFDLETSREKQILRRLENDICAQ